MHKTIFPMHKKPKIGLPRQLAYSQIRFSYAQKVKVLFTKTGFPMHNIDFILFAY